MTQHTVVCQLVQAANIAAREECAAKWPNHCKTCEGWGEGKSWYEHHGPGLNERMSEACEDCSCQELCPRCGGPMTEYESKCSACAWDINGIDMGMPSAYARCNCNEPDVYETNADLFVPDLEDTMSEIETDFDQLYEDERQALRYAHAVTCNE